MYYRGPVVKLIQYCTGRVNWVGTKQYYHIGIYKSTGPVVVSIYRYILSMAPPIFFLNKKNNMCKTLILKRVWMDGIFFNFPI